MENVSRAFIMAFSMLMFVLGLTYSMYLINHLMSTSETLLDTVTVTNYYDNIKLTNSAVSSDSREVGVDTIVSTLYRYYKESYAVKIFDNSGLIQLFDINVETRIASGESELSGSVYATSTNRAYLFGAPWTGNINEHTRTRVDYFLNGEKGYINDVFVDYSGINFLENYRGRTFYETFTEYVYDGQTISTANGLETITGDRQESSKIIIMYTLKT